MSRRNLFQRILHKIPGVADYREQKLWQDDQLEVRKELVSKIDMILAKLVRIEKQLLQQGGLNYMGKTRATKDKIRYYRDRLDVGMVTLENSQRLQNILNFQKLHVEKLELALEKLEQQVQMEEGIEESLTAIYAVVDDAESELT